MADGASHIPLKRLLRESAFGRAEIATTSPLGKLDRKTQKLQTALVVEGKELADIDLVIEDGGPVKNVISRSSPRAFAPSFRDRLQFFTIERCH